MPISKKEFTYLMYFFAYNFHIIFLFPLYIPKLLFKLKVHILIPIVCLCYAFFLNNVDLKIFFFSRFREFFSKNLSIPFLDRGWGVGVTWVLFYIYIFFFRYCISNCFFFNLKQRKDARIGYGDFFLTHLQFDIFNILSVCDKKKHLKLFSFKKNLF